jgi:hypothetical protein
LGQVSYTGKNVEFPLFYSHFIYKLLIGLQVGEDLFDLTFQRLHEILFLSTFLLLFISVILLYKHYKYLLNEQHMQVKSSFFQFLKKFVGYTISQISFRLNLLAPTKLHLWNKNRGWIVLSTFSNMLTGFLQSSAKYYLNGLHLKHQILFRN